MGSATGRTHHNQGCITCCVNCYSTIPGRVVPNVCSTSLRFSPMNLASTFLLPTMQWVCVCRALFFTAPSGIHAYFHSFPLLLTLVQQWQNPKVLYLQVPLGSPPPLRGKRKYRSLPRRVITPRLATVGFLGRFAHQPCLACIS